MKNPYVLVIVPFKDETKLLVEFINSLFRSYVTGFSYSLICWDDGSTDDELNFLYNNISNMIVIAKHQNVGYTQAVYNIMEYAKSQTEYDHVLIANSDIKFEQGTFFSMVKRSLSNPNIAAVGGKVLKYDTPQILHTGTRLVNGEIEDPYCGLHRDDPKTNFVERRMWVNGCGVLYKLDILRKENLNFDLQFKPAYFEEADLMSKLNISGYSVMYEPKAIIHHIMNASHNHERSKYESVFWNNWNKYLSRWKPNFNSKQLQF